ncbi:MAG: NOB1 family endonuclease [Candidatus Hermodarchaeota archaeon]
MKEKPLIYIFDANIFLTGIDFNIIESTIFTTPSIIEEIKVKKYEEKNRNILNRILVAIEAKKLELVTPNEEYLEKVIFLSKKTGDFRALSDADKDLIAISLELLDNQDRNIIVFSNDYSIENLCSELNIPYFPLFKEGIAKKIIWEVYCPSCFKIYNSEDLYKNCEKCGSTLKRRPKR